MLNLSRRLNDGTYPLVFQIIHNRRKKLLYTGFHVMKEEFDSRKRKVNTNRRVNVKINREIRRMYRLLSKRILELDSSGEEYSVHEITSETPQSPARYFYLLKYISTQIDWKKEISKEGIGAAYHSTKQSLSKFLGNQDIRMSQISPKFVARYIDFLRNEGAGENTVNFYIRNFRTCYNLAVKEGLVSHEEYPFNDINAKPCRTIKRALSREDMSRLLHLHLPENSTLQFARDLFLFSFYTQGMSFVDIAFLQQKHICGEIINYSRHKSKQLIHIGITPQIQELFNRYGMNRDTNDKESYMFPIINPQNADKKQISAYKQYRSALSRINRALKKIAGDLNIRTPLTTYVARHTWATLARDNGVPISTISAGLGHTTEDMTHIYLKELDTDHLKQVNKMMNNLILNVKLR